VFLITAIILEFACLEAAVVMAETNAFHGAGADRLNYAIATSVLSVGAVAFPALFVWMFFRKGTDES
jgi:hypothetical protein